MYDMYYFIMIVGIDIKMEIEGMIDIIIRWLNF